MKKVFSLVLAIVFGLACFGGLLAFSLTGDNAIAVEDNRWMIFDAASTTDLFAVSGTNADVIVNSNPVTAFAPIDFSTGSKFAGNAIKLGRASADETAKVLSGFSFPSNDDTGINMNNLDNFSLFTWLYVPVNHESCSLDLEIILLDNANPEVATNKLCFIVEYNEFTTESERGSGSFVYGWNLVEIPLSEREPYKTGETENPINFTTLTYFSIKQLDATKQLNATNGIAQAEGQAGCDLYMFDTYFARKASAATKVVVDQGYSNMKVSSNADWISTAWAGAIVGDKIAVPSFKENTTSVETLFNSASSSVVSFAYLGTNDLSTKTGTLTSAVYSYESGTVIPAGSEYTWMIEIKSPKAVSIYEFNAEGDPVNKYLFEQRGTYSITFFPRITDSTGEEPVRYDLTNYGVKTSFEVVESTSGVWFNVAEVTAEVGNEFVLNISTSVAWRLIESSVKVTSEDGETLKVVAVDLDSKTVTVKGIKKGVTSVLITADAMRSKSGTEQEQKTFSNSCIVILTDSSEDNSVLKIVLWVVLGIAVVGSVWAIVVVIIRDKKLQVK